VKKKKGILKLNGYLKLEALNKKVSVLKVVHRSLGSVEKERLSLYILKDHLGSTRVVFSDVNNNGSVDASEILAQNQFNSFGMEMEGNWNFISQYCKLMLSHNHKVDQFSQCHLAFISGHLIEDH
jgi:hypothetical protein